MADVQARIGKYTAENGPTKASRHFSKLHWIHNAGDKFKSEARVLMEDDRSSEGI